MAFLRRTHTCGELREEHVGQTIVLNGWVNTMRDQKHFVFVDLRDREGLTQVVFEPERGEALFKTAQEVRSEWVLAIKGKVAPRLPDKANPKLATGLIEVKAEEIQILNRCPNPPFVISERPKGEKKEEKEDEVAGEEIRLQYRYLDLRRRELQHNLRIRHRLCSVIRNYLDREGFLDIETPMLGRSTPEGARDYLVPSRIFPGSWYALPQSPQIYKQLLMISGYDKYFQIARCMRDEDLRADRQPEFTQLDLEMSFVEEEDVFDVIEGLSEEIFAECLGVSIPTPFPRLSYAEVMRDYGTDKPDLRFEMKIIELSDIAGETEFRVFRDTLGAGGKVRALNVKGAAEQHTRKNLDQLTDYVKQFGAKGLAWLKVEEGKLTSPIDKFLPAEFREKLRAKTEAEPGDLILVVADSEEVVCQSLGNLRVHLAGKLGLVSGKDYKPAWIVGFPSFFWDEEEKRWVANHHPFTAPRVRDVESMEEAPQKVKARAYDLVLNGYECGGGSIRIHDPKVQQRVFKLLGMEEEEARARFGFLLDALKYGAPPHGGIALGLDRWAMILCGTSNIRDVIAFPKNQRARDMMNGAPAPVDARQLKELGL